MRKVFVSLNVLAILLVYGFACGALNLSPGTAGYSERFLHLSVAPFLGLTPLAGSVLAAGITLLAATAFLVAGSGDRRAGRVFHLSWSMALSAALLASALVVALVVVLILASASASAPARIGLLYTVALFEAAVGTAIAASLFFFRRKPGLYLPALVLLFLGISALGSMFWVGSGWVPG